MSAYSHTWTKATPRITADYFDDNLSRRRINVLASTDGRITEFLLQTDTADSLSYNTERIAKIILVFRQLNKRYSMTAERMAICNKHHDVIHNPRTRVSMREDSQLNDER